jgi:hypothetical protein
MSKSAYPDETALQAFLVASGVVSTAPTGVSDYIDGAAEEWERLTGFQPFLGASADASFYFDGPSPLCYLDLRGGFVSITSLATGITATDDTGTAQTVNQDWFAVTNPSGTIIGIDFNGPFSGKRTVKIVGKRGYSASIPDEVYTAILQKAAADCAVYLTGQGDITRMKQGPVEYELNESNIKMWRSNFERLALRYRRV